MGSQITDNNCIGTTSPNYQLELSTDAAAKLSTNTWIVPSDKRIKKEIKPFTDGLNVVLNINPVKFQYNGKMKTPDDGKEHIGIIAQEIQKAAPYTVGVFKAKLDSTDAEETELLNFNSHALTFVLINAIKEQQKIIEALKTEMKQNNAQHGKEIAEIKLQLNVSTQK